MSSKRIIVLENNSELGAGTRGARLGIEALKIAALNLKKDYFTKYKREFIETRNDAIYDDIELPFLKRGKQIEASLSGAMDAVSNVIDRNKFPIVLSGDHSNAAGTIAGLRAAMPDKRIGVVWIDAHADLHSPYTSPSGNVHGMPLAIALGVDNVEHRVNAVDHETSDTWKSIKNIGGVEGKFDVEDLVFVGVRDTEDPEDYFIAENKIKQYSVEQVRRTGVKEISDEILGDLKACDFVYVSFDVDSMDCDLVSYGTGTPVPNGLTENEASGLINHLLIDKKVGCFEIVEINPCLDNKQNAMAEAAMRILEGATNIIEKRG